jgi:hypothetical protein
MKENVFKKIHNDFPIFLCEKFKILPESEVNRLKENILLENKKHRPKNDINFEIKDCKNILKDIFYSFKQSLIDNFKIEIDEEKTNEKYWVHCSNFSTETYVWHNHLRTSSVHCVYYLTMPNCAGGEIDFELNKNFFSYKPNQFDMIMMPNFLNHAPRPPLSYDYRISINMEVFCK